MIHFRAYQDSDQADCLAIFRSNVPKYFGEKEISGFIESLADPDDLFEVLIVDEKIIGVGGIAIIQEREEGRLCFGIIHRDHHKKGFGKLLLERRLERILEYEFVKKITHETGEGTYRFFEKYGFQTLRIDDDPEGIGIDFYQMEKRV